MRHRPVLPILILSVLALAACWEEESDADTATAEDAAVVTDSGSAGATADSPEPVAADQASEKLDQATARASAQLESNRKAQEAKAGVTDGEELERLLTPEGFDADKLRAMLEKADGVDEADRIFLMNSLEQIETDPELLDAFRQRFRDALAG